MPYIRVCENVMKIAIEAAMSTVPTSTAPEVEIIRRIEDLIRKLASGEATNQDRQCLVELQKQRVDLMLPKFPEKRRVRA